MLIAQLVGPHVCGALYGNFLLLDLPSSVEPLTQPNSRLPVRALLFQCSICHHGGHQSCYRSHYMCQPMVDLPTPSPPPKDDFRDQEFPRPALSASSIADDDSESTVSIESSTVEIPPFDSPKVSRMTRLRGHPCAAGCGHFCWATSRRIDEF